MVNHDRSNRGERSPFAKLTEASIVSIRERYAAGETQEVLSKEFGIERSNISMIVTGKKWQHVGGPLVLDAQRTRKRQGARHNMAKLTTEQVVEIRERYAAGETADQLAKVFPVIRDTVYRVVIGEVYPSEPGPISPRSPKPTKVTSAQVLEIRRRYATGETGVVLAKEFGVRTTCISAIVNRKTWQHI